MREADLQRAIRVALERRGVYVVRAVVAGRAGTPDLLCCVDGRFVALEVKMPGRRPTPLQEVEAQRVEAAGGLAAVVTSVTEALAALG